MNRADLYAGLLAFCEAQQPLNTHCHHLPDGAHPSLGLEGILKNSYLSWCHCPVPESGETAAAFFEAVRGRACFTALERALQRLYGLEEPLDAEHWERYDGAIRRAHRDPEHHLRLLTTACGYSRVLNDPYWDPGSDGGHPGFFTPALRVNLLFFGYAKDVRDHNGHSPFTSLGWDASMGFSDYLDAAEAWVEGMAARGCAALKSALAYDRGLGFKETPESRARQGFQNPGASPGDIRAFQDFLFFRLCALAARLNLPFQQHTGLGRMRGTRALRLREAIEKNPGTRFVLFHGSYPWTGDVAGLLFSYPNVQADLCWLPLLSPSVCERVLLELIEAGGLGRISFGCDTWTGEESYGALLAFREVLARVFSGLVRDRVLSLARAEEGICRFLSGNAGRALGLRP